MRNINRNFISKSIDYENLPNAKPRLVLYIKNNISLHLIAGVIILSPGITNHKVLPI